MDLVAFIQGEHSHSTPIAHGRGSRFSQLCDDPVLFGGLGS